MITGGILTELDDAVMAINNNINKQVGGVHKRLDDYIVDNNNFHLKQTEKLSSKVDVEDCQDVNRNCIIPMKQDIAKNKTDISWLKKILLGVGGGGGTVFGIVGHYIFGWF